MSSSGTEMARPSSDPSRKRRLPLWLIALATTALIVIAAIVALCVIGQRPWLTTNVTIPLSYVGDDGHTYSCTYDYRTSERLPMPEDIAESMNERDWSQTGQLIYEWAKDHPAESWTTEDELPADDPRSSRADSSWSLAKDEYVVFPPWTIDTDDGRDFELWWEVRPGSTCADGLR
jgi:hypothetical protein